jgi:hypothetical protein
MLTTTGMVFFAMEEKEEGCLSPGRVLTAMRGDVSGVWKNSAAKTNEPMAAHAKAPNEYFFWDIGFLLLRGRNRKTAYQISASLLNTQTGQTEYICKSI